MTKLRAAVGVAVGALLLTGCAGATQPAATPTPSPTATTPALADTICGRLHKGESVITVGHDMWANSSKYPDEATAVYAARQVMYQYCPQYAGQ
jgi:hypothetical protein